MAAPGLYSLSAMSDTGPALLCFDGSDEAAHAITAAAALVGEREAIVLTVAVPAADELPVDPVGDLVGRTSGLYREWDEIATHVAARHAAAGCELAREAGFEARAEVAHGKPAAAILRVAEDVDAAVIVLGSGRRGHVPGLLGSVAGRVAHHSSRPLLIIPVARPTDLTA